MAVLCYNYSSNQFLAVHSNFTYDSKAYGLTKLYLETSHSESGQTTAVESFFREPINLL